MSKIILALALVLLSGCSVETAEPAPIVYHVYTSCTTVTDTAPNDDCSEGQLSVTRCNNATESPDTDHCTGPASNQGQASGVVWCCK